MKKRALLSALPAANDTLQRRVADLEACLAAAQAEAKSLRDQVTFLRGLLGSSFGSGVSAFGNGDSMNSASFSAGAVAGQAALAASSALVAASDSSNAANPPGALVLALACVLTLNNCGGVLVVASEWGNEWAGSVGLSSGSEGSGHGGRVLLSVDEDSSFGGSSSNLGTLLGRPNAGLFPEPVVAVASLLSLCLWFRIFFRAVLIPAVRTGRSVALCATSGCALPMWRSCADSSGRWAAYLPKALFWFLSYRRSKPHEN